MQLEPITTRLSRTACRPATLVHAAASALALALTLPATDIAGYALLATAFALTLSSVVQSARFLDRQALALRFPRITVGVMSTLPVAAVTAVFAVAHAMP